MATDQGPAQALRTTGLAAQRTLLAYERTLMAWVRTATSLISFGFAIYKFFQFMSEIGKEVRHVPLLGPNMVAGTMIVVGLVALLLAWISIHRQMRSLCKSFEIKSRSHSLASLLAAFVLGIGLLALTGVAFQL